MCSIKIKPNQTNFFASGSNDNKVVIWDTRKDEALTTLKGHKGAVKAISWCPWKSSLLATGGGKNDRTIKIWGENMELVSSHQTHSQISGLEWNGRYRSLISAHGANTNEVSMWSY